MNADILANVSFQKEGNMEKREKYMESLPEEHEELCHWKSDFISDEDTYFLLYKDDCVGAVRFYEEPNFVINNVNYFYVLFRCSWGKIIHKNVSWGRILWSYILNKIHEFSSDKSFVVFNMTTAPPHSRQNQHHSE